jgi:hypothetical protein
MKRPNYQVVKHYSKVIDNLYQKICNKYINAHTCNIKGDLQSVCKQSLCLHFCVQNIELYSTTIYIFKLVEYNK